MRNNEIKDRLGRRLTSNHHKTTYCVSYCANDLLTVNTEKLAGDFKEYVLRKGT